VLIYKASPRGRPAADGAFSRRIRSQDGWPTHRGALALSRAACPARARLRLRQGAQRRRGLRNTCDPNTLDGQGTRLRMPQDARMRRAHRVSAGDECAWVWKVGLAAPLAPTPQRVSAGGLAVGSKPSWRPTAQRRGGTPTR